MVTQLQVYNLALLKLKQSTLATITDAKESRRVLDTLWDPSLKLLLESGFWKFAMRTVSITADSAITPEFGPSNAFNMPSDWVKTYQISANEDFNPPLEIWLEESGLIFADEDPIYLRYVSNSDAGYGEDLNRWTGKFTDAMACYLAWQGAPKIAGSSDNMVEKLEKDYILSCSTAKSFEALREPAKRLPQGRWNTARFGQGLRDRGGR